MSPSPIPSDLLEPDPPFNDDELLASLTALLDEALKPADASIDGTDERGDERSAAAAKVERWQITGVRSAEWAMSKFCEFMAIVDENKQAAEDWRAIIYASVADALARIDEWEADANKPHLGRAKFFEDHLTRWALANRTKDRKSFPLPSGTITTSASSNTYEIVKGSQADAVAFARKRDLAVKEETTITALKAAVVYSEVAVRVRDRSLDTPPPEGTSAPPVAGFRWLPIDGIKVEWVPDPRPDDADEFWDEGRWRVTDLASDEIVADADVWEGPFILDKDTGEPLPFLTPKPSVVTAKVVPA